jgi:hypothetical protein
MEMELKTRFEDGTRPISRQSLGARERIASASASSASRRTNVSSVFQGARTNQLHQRLGTSVPHLLVRRPARGHSWSNVTDRELESSTRLGCLLYFLALRLCGGD